MHAVQHSREAGNFELSRTIPASQSKVYTYNTGYVSGGTHTADRLISRGGNKTRVEYTGGIRRIHQPRRIHGRYTHAYTHTNTDMHTSKSEQGKEGERVRRARVSIGYNSRVPREMPQPLITMHDHEAHIAPPTLAPSSRCCCYCFLCCWD
uniref:Uncharacterized protein n=1 Tax=Trichogramma kaykai TaxID=54128 RepID=A0ABD2XN70_9HYME